MDKIEQFLQATGRRADAELAASDQPRGPEAIVSNVTSRIRRRNEIYFSSALLIGLLSVTLLSWQWNKLDWEMARTSWPGYSQYQQFRVVADHDNH